MKTKFSAYKNQGQNKTITHQGPMSPEVWCLAMCNSLSFQVSNLNDIIHAAAKVPTEYKLAFLGINRSHSAKWFDSSFILKHLGWIIEWKPTLWSCLEKSIQSILKKKNPSVVSSDISYSIEYSHGDANTCTR